MHDEQPPDNLSPQHDLSQDCPHFNEDNTGVCTKACTEAQPSEVASALRRPNPFMLYAVSALYENVFEVMDICYRQCSQPSQSGQVQKELNGSWPQINLHGTGKSGQVNLHGTGRSGQVNLYETGRSGQVNLHETGRSGQVNLHGTGKSGQVNLYETGKSGQVNLYETSQQVYCTWLPRDSDTICVIKTADNRTLLFSSRLNALYIAQHNFCLQRCTPPITVFMGHFMTDHKDLPNETHRIMLYDVIYEGGVFLGDSPYLGRYNRLRHMSQYFEGSHLDIQWAGFELQSHQIQELQLQLPHHIDALLFPPEYIAKGSDVPCIPYYNLNVKPLTIIT
jgi:hypothetical protein